jgi:hypothetical protein
LPEHLLDTGSEWVVPISQNAFDIIFHQQKKELLLLQESNMIRTSYHKRRIVTGCKTDFTATSSFEASNWEKYTKHDYAIFNQVYMGEIYKRSCALPELLFYNIL